MFPPHRKRLGGFTLTEVMITVGILSILAALLVPRMQVFIAQSQASHCLENLRQMHGGFMLYAADNKGEIPRYREVLINPETGEAERGEFWGQRIKPYLVSNSNEPVKYNLCPAEKILPATHYGMNASISENRPEPLAATPLQSRRFLLGDANGQARLTVGAFAEDAAFRHPEGRMNLLFLDGHVEARTYAEIPIPANGFSTASSEYKAFFRGTQ